MKKQKQSANMKYRTFHAKVVEACVQLTKEQYREFWNKQCDFLEEFERRDSPEDAARSQVEHLDWCF